MAAATVPAECYLLSDYDEGRDLRLGWLDSSGRPRWEYPGHSSGDSGDAADGEFGPSTQSTYLLPPQYETSTLVFAWPEIRLPRDHRDRGAARPVEHRAGPGSSRGCMAGAGLDNTEITVDFDVPH